MASDSAKPIKQPDSDRPKPIDITTRLRQTRGWRIFWCEECGERWESASRDRASPSGEDCQRCGEWVFPHDSRPDNSLTVDEFGNLTKAYDRVKCAIGHP